MLRKQFNIPFRIIYTQEDGTKNVFIRNEEIGHGTFAIVYRVTHQSTNNTYAMKVISKEAYSKSKKALEKLKNEIEIQNFVDHPNVVRSDYSFSDEYNYYLVLEYCPGKTIREYLYNNNNGRLTEPETRKILKDIIQGLAYLHSHQIIHYDLKLENFIIDFDGNVKIADFGLSTFRKNEEGKKYSISGTPNYLSPEILRKEKRDDSYKADIWAIGISAYMMLTGKGPFEGNSRESTFENIKKGQFYFPFNISISSDAKEFIKSILQEDYHKRPTAVELLSHPFLTKVDKDPVILYKSNNLPQLNRPTQKVPNTKSGLPQIITNLSPQKQNNPISPRQANLKSPRQIFPNSPKQVNLNSPKPANLNLPTQNNLNSARQAILKSARQNYLQSPRGGNLNASRRVVLMSPRANLRSPRQNYPNSPRQTNLNMARANLNSARGGRIINSPRQANLNSPRLNILSPERLAQDRTPSEKQANVISPRRSSKGADRQGNLNQQKLPSLHLEKPSVLISTGQDSLSTGKQNNLSNDKHSNLNSEKPSTLNSGKPSYLNSEKPSTLNSEKPSTLNSGKPSYLNSEKPSTLNSEKPSNLNSDKRSYLNSGKPSILNSEKPSNLNSDKRSYLNSGKPSNPKPPAQKPTDINPARHFTSTKPSNLTAEKPVSAERPSANPSHLNPARANVSAEKQPNTNTSKPTFSQLPDTKPLPPTAADGKKNFSIPSHFISRHCFYSDDLGYLLGDGTVGVCFKDGSSIVMDPHEQFVQLYKNQNSVMPEVIKLFEKKAENHPKIEKIKKVAKNFKKIRFSYEITDDEYDPKVPLHNVKCYVKDDESILFKLDDKNLQVNFNDHVKLIIFWNTKQMCFFKSIREKCSLLDLKYVANMNSNSDELKKFKNAKVLLSNLAITIC